jgi:hypothetical protein
MWPYESTREPARLEIIESCDDKVMSECAVHAEEAGDAVDTEFWWLEVATALTSDDAIARGVRELCDRVLIPQGRLEEAELDSRHLVTRQF